MESASFVKKFSKKSNYFQSCINLFKGFIGGGVLALPLGFY